MRNQLVLSCLVVGMIAVTGCGGGEEEKASPAPAPSGPVKELDVSATVLTDYIEDAMPSPIEDYVEAFWGDSEYLFKPVFGGAEPWVAKDLERIDPLTWRIGLRPGVKFQNGKPVDAAAVVEWLKYEIENDAFAAGVLGEPTSIEADGEMGVIVKTKAVFEAFAHGLANTSLPVTDVAALKEVGKDYNETAGKGIYTGPFALQSVKPGVREYVRNVNYWDGPVALKGFTLRKLTDPQAGLRAVQGGEADIVLNPPPRSSITAKGNAKLAYLVASRAVSFIAAVPNARKPPFDDVAVRKAFALALDNDTIAKTASFGLYPTLAGLFPSGTPYSHDWKRFDLEEARQVLEDAGWKDPGSGIREKAGKKLSVVLYTYTELLEATATAMTDTLRQAGFDANVRAAAGFADIADPVQNQGGVTVLYAENYGYDGNPVTSLGVLYLKATYQDGPSFTSPPDQRIIELVDSLLKNSDPAVLESGMIELGRLNEEGAFYIPIMERSNTLLTSDAYRHLEPDAFFLFFNARTAPRP